MVLLAPYLQMLEVRHNQGRGELLVFAHHHDAADERRLRKTVLNECGRDVLTHRILKDFLHTTRDLQQAVFIELTDVARMEVALFVDGDTGLLLIFVIALHHWRALHKNLSRLRVDLELHAAAWYAHRSCLDDTQGEAVGGNHGRGLGQTVALDNRDVHGGKQAHQTGLQAGATRNDELQATTERFPHILEHQPIGDMQLKSIGTVDLLLRLVVTLGQLESPIEDAFLHAFQFVAFTDNAIINLLYDTRHRGEVFRLDIGDVAHDGAEVLHIIGRVAEIEVREQHRTLVDVRQRQETHHFV